MRNVELFGKHTHTVTKRVCERSWYALNDFQEQIKETGSVAHSDDGADDNDTDMEIAEEPDFENPLSVGAKEGAVED